jgi:hypothetical protein
MLKLLFACLILVSCDTLKGVRIPVKLIKSNPVKSVTIETRTKYKRGWIKHIKTKTTIYPGGLKNIMDSVYHYYYESKL